MANCYFAKPGAYLYESKIPNPSFRQAAKHYKKTQTKNEIRGI